MHRVCDLLLLALLLLGTAVAVAQDRPVPAPLTEIETLRIENVRLEGVILQRELNDWQAKRAQLVKDLEAARGDKWTWNPETQQFTAKKTE